MINLICKNEVRCPETKTAKIMRDNILDARNAISQVERANYILKIRSLVKEILTKSII